MHIRHALALAAGSLLLTAAPAAVAHADDDDATVTVDSIGHVAHDGTVTLSGSYRCVSDGSPGPMLITAGLRKGDVASGLSGTTATCDGRVHRWRSSGRPSLTAYGPGRARVQATLMKLSDDSGLALPHFYAAQDRDVTLVRDRH